MNVGRKRGREGGRDRGRAGGREVVWEGERKGGRGRSKKGATPIPNEDLHWEKTDITSPSLGVVIQ